MSIELLAPDVRRYIIKNPPSEDEVRLTAYYLWEERVPKAIEKGQPVIDWPGAQGDDWYLAKAICGVRHYKQDQTQENSTNSSHLSLVA